MKKRDNKVKKSKPVGKLADFNKFYRDTVIVCAVLLAVAIVMAVYFYVLAGLAVAILTAIFYAVAVKRKLKKLLSLGYFQTSGGIGVFVDGNNSVMKIPSRLMWQDVVKLVHRVDKGERSVETLRLPSSLIYIDSEFFSENTELRTVIYEGSMSEFCQLTESADISAITVIALKGEK